MGEVSEQATEIAADVAEEVIEPVVQEAIEVHGFLKTPGAILTIALGVAGGAAVGYWYASKRLKDKYNRIAEAEIEEMREHFKKRLAVKEEKPDLDEVVTREGYAGPTKIGEPQDEVVSEEVPGLGPQDLTVEVEEEVQEVQRPTEPIKVVRESDTDTKKDPEIGWDHELEIQSRRSDKPYIIHMDEQLEGEYEDYTETTLIYYMSDDVLCDPDDRVVSKDVVGVDNLEKFGHGSNNWLCVYIRNEVLEFEAKVVKNPGSYAEVVHGFVQHTGEPQSRRRASPDDE